MKRLWLVVLMLLLAGCASASPITPTVGSSAPALKNPIAIPSEPMTAEPSATESADFRQRARDMGYSDALLELLANMEIPEEQILNPVPIGNGLVSPNGRYVLDSYEIHAFFSCGYLRDTLTDTVQVFPYWFAGYGDSGFLDEERFYVALPQVGGVDFEAGISLYHTAQPQEPYAAWQLADGMNSDNERRLLGTIHNPDRELFLVDWYEIPAEWGGQIQEETENHRITLVNYAGHAVQTVDTGIRLRNGKAGAAPLDFVKPNVDVAPSRETIWFSTREDTYAFEWDTGAVRRDTPVGSAVGDAVPTYVYQGEVVTGLYTLDWDNRAYRDFDPVYPDYAEAVSLLEQIPTQDVNTAARQGFLLVTEQNKYAFTFDSAQQRAADDPIARLLAIGAGEAQTDRRHAQWFAYMSNANIARVTFRGGPTNDGLAANESDNIEVDTTDPAQLGQIGDYLKGILVAPEPIILSAGSNNPTMTGDLYTMRITFATGVVCDIFGHRDSLVIGASDRREMIQYRCGEEQIQGLRDLMNALEA